MVFYDTKFIFIMAVFEFSQELRKSANLNLKIVGIPLAIKNENLSTRRVVIYKRRMF